MTATQIRIPEQFRATLNASPDCMTIRLVLADWFAEQGEPMAEECLRWTVEKGRVPYVSGNWHYFAVTDADRTGYQRSAHLPNDMALMGYMIPMPNQTTRSVSALFDYLLREWASSTEEQRKEWWKWTAP